MLMDADAGEGGIQNHPKSADVVYGRPQSVILKLNVFTSLIAAFCSGLTLSGNIDRRDMAALLSRPCPPITFYNMLVTSTNHFLKVSAQSLQKYECWIVLHHGLLP